MQHNNNNNNAIATELNSIIISLAGNKAEDLSKSLEMVESKISHLEHLSHEMNIPELRALTHWMMLNTELDDNNEAQIVTLIEDGSYYNWMDVLSMLLQDYDQTLLPIIYKTLTEPKWIVKPSAPLLRNLASWIDTARVSAQNQAANTEEMDEDKESAITAETDSTIAPSIKTESSLTNETHKHTKNKYPSNDKNFSTNIEFANKHIFEEVESAILEKNYDNTNIESSFNEKSEDESKGFITEKSSNFYDEIEEDIAIDPTEELFSSQYENESTDIKVHNNKDTEEATSVSTNNEENDTSKYTTYNDLNNSDDLLLEEEADDFSIEVDDIIMSLATISAQSEESLDNTQAYVEELQRFNMLSDISGYGKLVSISNWCQENLLLFSENPTNDLQQFVESGECWTWMELVKLAITDPDELSVMSELNAELSREEWLIPLETEELQSLLLFLHNPQDSNAQPSAETIEDEDKSTTDGIIAESEVDEAIVSTTTANTEIPELSFKWDDDVHPELLEVYFEETSENITEISQYLKNIGSVKTTKEQRQDARRTAHTIKGGSAVVGLTALSTYAYQLEKILDYAIDHSLPDETDELLQVASNGVQELYESIKDKKQVADDYFTTLSKLTLCAETLEELDDEPLELSTPVLPDFITQQNESNGTLADEKTETDSSEEYIEDKQHKPLEEIDAPENSINDEDDIEKQTELDPNIAINDKIEDIDESILPALTAGDELNDFTAELDDIVMTLITTDVNTNKKPFILDAYIEELQRLDMLAVISGYPEIVTVNSWYQENLKLIAKKGTKKLGKFISSGESWAWIELVSASLADPADISHLSALSTELTRAEWVKTLDIEALQDLLLILRDPEEEVADTQEATEPQSIDDGYKENSLGDEDSVKGETITNDNIITWDDDVHPELLSVYLQETSEQITKIAELLHLISKGKADKDQQEHAARIAHTIKGASGVVGISEIVDFTHKLEDILDYAVNNEIPEETAELLAESSDCLESLFEAVQEKAHIPEEFEPVLSKLIAYAKTIEDDTTAIEESPSELEMPELPDFIKNSDEFKDIIETEDKTAELKSNEKSTIENTFEDLAEEISLQASVSNNNNDTPVNEAHIRVPTALINKLLNLAGELVTTSSQVSDKVERTLETTEHIKEQDKRVHDMLEELSSTIYKQEKDQMTMLSSMQNEDFDTLEMDTYNELHSVAGLLTESILDSETIESTLKNQLNEIHDDLRLLDNLNKELSETILNSRMESLNTLIPRLERIVRQTCRKTGKEADLVVTGNDINIDTEILSGLVDPLLHLLRNAIDHGIESPSDRESKSKEQTGKIQLNFSRQGNFIHMQLKDDGAGIDSEKIYQHAINKGIITPDQEFSKNEILKLILEPGFSTQTDVTDISGRGVGMDVVNKGIEALKGSLTITSELGKGSSFNVRIPLTLITSSTLLVEAAGNKVAIPTDSIEQLYYLSPEDVLSRDDNKFIRHEGKELAIESLAGILGWTVTDVDFTKAQTLLLVKGNQQLHAIYIDQIIHSREVVIKSLAHFIDDTNGIIGACHLSDGEVAPVMNLPQLLSLHEKSSHVVKHIDPSEIATPLANQIPQILVVDDSLSNRKALSLIIDKTEYDVVTAVDGLDALNVMNEQHIDLVFTDLEMPRMTGLELTQAIRAWDEKKEVPIVMVTSRSTNKHRELAKKAGVDDYLTKPVSTDTLLDSIETWLNQTVEA